MKIETFKNFKIKQGCVSKWDKKNPLDTVKDAGNTVLDAATLVSFGIATSALGSDDTLKTTKFDALSSLFANKDLVKPCQADGKCAALAGLTPLCGKVTLT